MALSLLSSPAWAVTKIHRVASRKWVVKLKQNSWTNRRPFQFAAPLYNEGILYVGINRGIFYAVNAKRGKKLWQFNTQGSLHGKPAVLGEKVFVADTKGFVYAFDKIRGKLLWVTPLEEEILSTPLVIDGKLYLVSLGKVLSVLNPETGSLLWQRRYGREDPNYTIRASADPVLAEGRLLIGYSDGTLAAHDPANGNVLWVKQLGDPFEEFHDVDATTLVVGKLAYVTSADQKLFALNPANGEIIWTAPIGSVNDVAFAEPFLYVSAGGVIYCLKADSGEVSWEQQLNHPALSAPAIYDKWLAVVAAKGEIFFFDRQGGDLYHSWHVKGGSYSDPIVEGNFLYLLSNASRLYGFEFR